MKTFVSCTVVDYWVKSAGCLQLLEISWNLNLVGPPGNFCVRRRRSTALVSSHKTGYQIAYLRNWSPYFIFATAPCCIKCISYSCSMSRQTTSVHYIGGRSKAWIFLKSLLESPRNLLDYICRHPVWGVCSRHRWAEVVRHCRGFFGVRIICFAANQ